MFHRHTNALVAVGVNLVVPASACVAHAEVVALSLGGQAMSSFDVSVRGCGVHWVGKVEDGGERVGETEIE